MKDLIAKINEGKYLVSTKDPLSIECALFLTQCLQANELDRIDMLDLLGHPFVEAPELDIRLTTLDPGAYHDELDVTSKHQSSSLFLNRASTSST